MIRLALAGGSDGRPPREPRTGQIIRFPVERLERSKREPPPGGSHPDKDNDHAVIQPPTARSDGPPPRWPRVFPGL